jgi:hypothetical protein
MDWYAELLERLAGQPCGGYGRTDSAATEPSALAALALARAGWAEPVRRVADWLAQFQSPDGSVGVRATEAEPCWTTSLAVLTWNALHRLDPTAPYQSCIDRAFRWIIAHRGVTLENAADRGHDASLPAWPWVDATHMWVEPTALHVLALKRIGHSAHSRTRDAVKMLLDRQVATGGWNYGNTVVLGRRLRSHVQPTGLALLALADEVEVVSRTKLAPSVRYLHQQLGPATATASLCWGLLGLAACGESISGSADWLEAAYRRTLLRDQSVHKLALIALAGRAEPTADPLAPLSGSFL